jgi:hypothetical protein
MVGFGAHFANHVPAVFGWGSFSFGGHHRICIFSAALAALSFFRLGSLFVWVLVLGLVIRASIAFLLALLTAAAGLACLRLRKRRT